tara:strand:- start:5447 stop:6055 length:609 start_codon:yes stop_codon:yes gene_type:complete
MRGDIMNVEELATNYSYEELARALYIKGERDGFSKITDKTKWREPVVANKLGHTAHPKISAGEGKDEYGSDAFDPIKGKYAEYKSQAIVEKQLNNLFERSRGKRNYVPLKVNGVYNGAYKQEAIDAYKDVDHYFGIFYKELCVLVIKPNTDEVIRQLEYNLAKMNEKGKSTNLNTVTIDLKDEMLYTVAYKNEEFYIDNIEE